MSMKQIYTLHFAGWHVDNTDMRALLLLGYSLALSGRNWEITKQYEFGDPEVPPLHKYEHGTDPVPLPPTF